MKWHIGCSGFHYKHWREKFYPKGLAMKHWFEYYIQNFDTVELNVTHYKFPDEKNLAGWYDKSSKDFLFAVKMYKGITHYKKLHDCKKMVDDFYAIVGGGLREKAACILFQFPSTFHYNDRNMDRILNNLDGRFQNVVEFRHSSWWNGEAWKIFSEHSITFCSMSHPDLPDNIVSTGPVIYCRMHGVPTLYASNYSKEELEEVTDEIRKQKKTKSSFVYFNNDNNAFAVSNAKEMKEIIAYGNSR